MGAARPRHVLRLQLPEQFQGRRVVAGGVQLVLELLFDRARPPFLEVGQQPVQPRLALGVAAADVLQLQGALDESGFQAYAQPIHRRGLAGSLQLV
jgi:hypothetical protein